MSAKKTYRDNELYIATAFWCEVVVVDHSLLILEDKTIIVDRLIFLNGMIKNVPYYISEKTLKTSIECGLATEVV